MKHSIKAAMLSGFLFPGVGQIVRTHYKRGIFFMTTAILSIIVIVANAIKKSVEIINEIEMSGGVIDMSAISNVALKTYKVTDSFLFNATLYLTLVLP